MLLSTVTECEQLLRSFICVFSCGSVECSRSKKGRGEERGRAGELRVQTVKGGNQGRQREEREESRVSYFKKTAGECLLTVPNERGLAPLLVVTVML